MGVSSLFNQVSASGTDWFPVLMDAAVKGMAVLSLAGLATLIMRRSSAAARHLVWFLGVFSLLILPILSATLPGWYILPRLVPDDPAPVQPPAAPVIVAPAPVPSSVDPPEWETQPLPQETLADPPVAPLASSPLPPTPVSSLPRLPWQAWVVLAWLLASVLLLMHVMLGYVSLWWLRRRSSRITQGPWPILLQQVSGQLGLRRPVELLVSPRRAMPMTWGLWRTRLLLPEESTRWPSDQCRAVLLHELAHAKRWDCLTQLVAQIACALHWFNPLVWVAWRRMQTERERACDDLVLSTGAKASTYAEQLLHIASDMPTVRFSAAAIAMARPSKLEGRLLAILDATRNRKRLALPGVLLAILLITAIVVPVAVLRARTTDAAQPEPEKHDEAAADPAQMNPAALLERLRAEDKAFCSDAELIVEQTGVRNPMAMWQAPDNKRLEISLRGESWAFRARQADEGPPAYTDQAGPMDYDRDGNLIAWRDSLGGALREPDFYGQISKSVGWRVPKEGTAKVFSSSMPIVTLYPPFPWREDTVQLPLLCAGRDYSHYITEITSVTPADDGLLEVEAKGIYSSSASGTWHLVVDPNARYMVRAAKYEVPDHVYLDLKSTGLRKVGSTFLPDSAPWPMRPEGATLKFIDWKPRHNSQVFDEMRRETKGPFSKGTLISDMRWDTAVSYDHRVEADQEALDGLEEAARAWYIQRLFAPDANPEIRERVAKALGVLKGDSAVEALIKALKDEAVNVRSEAARSLGQIGDPRAVDPLIEMYRDRKGESFKAALQALGDIGGEKARRVLTEALRNQDAAVRAIAAKALGQSATQPTTSPAHLPAELDREVNVRVYDVRDIVEKDLRRRGSESRPAGDNGPRADDLRTADEQDRKRRTQDLCRLIKEFIEPGTWEPEGTVGAMDVWNERLIVRHTAAVHHRLADVFRQVRELDDDAGSLETKFRISVERLRAAHGTPDGKEPSAAERPATSPAAPGPKPAPVFRSITLPDADRDSARAIADLASGDLLPAVTARAGRFAGVARGDLAYRDLLLCLRGAKASIWKDGKVTPLEPLTTLEDVSGYEIPDEPAALYVRTAAGDLYEMLVFYKGSNELDLQYRRVREPVGEGLTGVIRLPDGSPATGARIVLCTPNGPPVDIHNGSLGPLNRALVTEVGSDGRYAFPPQPGPYSLIAIHDRGWRLLHSQDRPASGEIMLQPWAQIEGTFRIGSRPVADAVISLRMGYMKDLHDERRIGVDCSAITDQDGRFSFKQAPPGDGTLGRLFTRRKDSDGGSLTGSSPRYAIHLEPGQVLPVPLGGVGRPVVGRLLAPAGVSDVDWQWNDSHLIPRPEGLAPAGLTPQERQEYAEKMKRTPDGRIKPLIRAMDNVVLVADGTFRIEDVPAGAYQLEVLLYGSPPRGGESDFDLDIKKRIGAISYRFIMPEVPGGRSDEPLDLGELPLNPDLRTNLGATGSWSGPSANPPRANADTGRRSATNLTDTRLAAPRPVSSTGATQPANAAATPASPASAPPAVAGELAGTVTDDAGKPLAGALIDVWTWYPGKEAMTDQQGRFVLRDLGSDPVEIRVSKEGYGPWYDPNQVTGVSDIQISLSNKTYFEGSVKGPDGKPVSGALIRADCGPKRNPGVVITTVWTETRSDANGHYRLYVMPDQYDIQVRVPNVGAARFAKVWIDEDEKQTLDIKLERGVTFQATVVDSQSGDPVPNVRLWHFEHKGIEGTSDKNGKVVITGMPPGKFTFDVQAKGYKRWWSAQAAHPSQQKNLRESFQRNFDYLAFVLDEDMEPVTVEVEREVRITGVVQDPDGKPVAGATVAPARTGSGNSLTGDTRFSVVSGKDGTFVMSLPASGSAKYNLVAHDGKYQEWRKWANGVLDPIQTRPGDELKDIVIKLTRPATVRGQVKDASGEPVANREVRASAADKLENRYYDPTTRTDKNGNFELRFVRAGRQYIQVAPFWQRGSVEVTLKEGEVKQGVVLEEEASDRSPIPPMRGARPLAPGRGRR